MSPYVSGFLSNIYYPFIYNFTSPGNIGSQYINGELLEDKLEYPKLYNTDESFLLTYNYITSKELYFY